MTAAKLVGMMVRGDGPIEELIKAGQIAFLYSFKQPATVAYISSKHEIVPEVEGVKVMQVAWIPYKSWACVGRTEVAMNEVELTKLFVEYAEVSKKADELRSQIETQVLRIGETRKMAGVTATYYKPGFETPDYATYGKQYAPQYVIDNYTKTTTTTAWAEVCKEMDIEVPPGAPKPARVVVKA